MWRDFADGCRATPRVRSRDCRSFTGWRPLADVEFADDVIVQPDVFVAPLVNGKPPRDWSDVKSLILAVEVLSRGTAYLDRTRKDVLYQREGVPEYWIVDVNARLIERWRPEDTRPEILTERLEWQPDPSQPPLVLDLPASYSPRFTTDR